MSRCIAVLHQLDVQGIGYVYRSRILHIMLAKDVSGFCRHFQNTEQETTAAEEKLFKLHQKVRTPDSYTSKSKARKLTKEFVQLSKSEDLLQENLRLPEEQVAELLYQLSTRGKPNLCHFEPAWILSQPVLLQSILHCKHAPAMQVALYRCCSHARLPINFP